MRSEHQKYVGILYAGIMLTRGGPKVLVFNCHFGDPETQALMPLMTSDLYLTCRACVEGTLKDYTPLFDKEQSTLSVVIVSDGYPGSYRKGFEITGTKQLLKITLF